ncbi:MAG: tRNA (N6-threonylcarbamoyladenosine(37)-N6)-methyltransferase TrmO [Deltaproteobacteria bacterium]|nr:tRNA (N6-threonylcarbamoyladenosine(37)-N6)-methyltransferase TrmO [Deltaproteobacteria bacterium]
MPVILNRIGEVRTQEPAVPPYWAESAVEGELIIDEEFVEGLKGIEKGDRIVVLFHFHKSSPFDPSRDLIQHPRGDRNREKRGVFDLCSPRRPNPIGMSVVTVISVERNIIRVKGLDIIDGTPILDIKPWRV